jgi:hypothetical protein
MSAEEEELSPVQQRIIQVTADESDEQARLLQAVENIPITSLDEIQVGNRVVIGARPAERRLRDDFLVVGLGASPLSNWTAGHLRDVGEDYPYRMWKRFAFFVEREIPAYNYGDYDDFRTHIWKLGELGLIRPTRTEPTDVEDREAKQFYEIVEDQLENPAWDDPSGALYG